MIKYGLKNKLRRFKSYKTLDYTEEKIERLNHFFSSIPSESIVLFVGLRQMKYFLNLDDPGNFLINLVAGHFKNVLVPTFTPSVINNHLFDIVNTKSESGSFSNIFLQNASFRTPSPFKSFAVVGPIIGKLQELQYDNDFLSNGIFDFINNQNIPSVNVGTDDIRFSCIHYAESVSSVPYVKMNKFTIEVYENGSYLYKKDFGKLDYLFGYKFNRAKIENDLTASHLITTEDIEGLKLRYIPQDGYFNYFLSQLKLNSNYLIS